MWNCIARPHVSTGIVSVQELSFIQVGALYVLPIRWRACFTDGGGSQRNDMIAHALNRLKSMARHLQFQNLKEIWSR